MKSRLGKVQYQIMQALWKLERATARQLTDELAKTQFIAHSTVQTLLRQMEAKGVVTHDVEERAFVYRALLQSSELPETPLHDLLTRLFHGSVVNLMSHLLKHETVSREELAQLRQMIEDTAVHETEAAKDASIGGKSKIADGADRKNIAGARTSEARNRKGDAR